MTASVLYLEQWEGITPVLLPMGPLTLSCINVAIIGVAVPFFIFLVSMFYLLMPIWLDNFHSDKALHQSGEVLPTKNSDMASAGYLFRSTAGDTISREQPVFDDDMISNSRRF